jgi:hypothetical protein
MGQIPQVAAELFPVVLSFALLLAFLFLAARCTTYTQRIEFWLIERERRIANPTPPMVPLESIAADVRRLRRSLIEAPPRAPLVRQRGLYLAYDQALVAAADTLEVPHTLEQLPLGAERDLERLELEAELEQAGLKLSA